MIGCFFGIVVLSLAKSNLFKSKVKIDNSSEFYFGLAMIFSTAIAFSIVGVMTRKMKSLHFSIIQFNYGFFSVGSLSLWIIIEFYSKSTENYGYDSIRISNYNWEQWGLLVLIAFLNSIGMNVFTLAFQKEQAAFITLIS